MKNIYIPIWLDLLYDLNIAIESGRPDLHSNMVRFIIIAKRLSKYASYGFTFQYG